ncbi:unannotated protein [freshwater metagenome]|uniref:Unannotated protein n=1 Tax=freshwater metagenome TaxID=449393 RepID=A0A6J6QB18_9ZZZZ
MASATSSVSRSSKSGAIVGSTVTARRTSRPRVSERAWTTIGFKRVSRTSLVNSLGAAIKAVSSTRPSGLVSATKARCCGVKTPSAREAKVWAQICARSVVATSTCSTMLFPIRYQQTVHMFIHRCGRFSWAEVPNIINHPLEHNPWGNFQTEKAITGTPV